MMNYSVVIPTNRTFDHIQPLLESFAHQTYLPSQIIIVLDHYYSSENFSLYDREVQQLFSGLSIIVEIVNPITDKNFVVFQGASYVRNYGLKKVLSPYMIYIDDDNIFADDFAQKIFEKWTKKEKIKKKDMTIIVPIQYDDETTYVRQAVADRFNFALCRPHRLTNRLINHTDRYCPLLLSSSNCLVGPTDVFSKFPFREDIPFVYEDLIMTGQMTKSGVSLLCDTRSSVIHAHGQRPKLAELYINTPQRAYYKAKHRIIFVHTIGSIKDLIVFYTLGLIGQLGWLGLHILMYASPKQRWSLLNALIRGTRDGIKVGGN